MAKILKNTTGSAIFLKFIGINIPANSSITIQPEDYLLLSSLNSITELTTRINAGTIVVNDGIRDLNATRGLNFIKYPDDARGSTFDNSSNGFTAYISQEAIEEAKATAIGKPRFTIVTTFNGTIGANNWLGYSELLPGNTSPIRLPINCVLKELSFSWVGSAVDGQFELYTNGLVVANRIYQGPSWTNQASGAIITGLNITISANDYIVGKWIDTGDNPSDMALVYYFQVT
jgi:hypothetical protein